MVGLLSILSEVFFVMRLHSLVPPFVPFSEPRDGK